VALLPVLGRRAAVRARVLAVGRGRDAVGLPLRAVTHRALGLIGVQRVTHGGVEVPAAGFAVALLGGAIARFGAAFALVAVIRRHGRQRTPERARSHAGMASAFSGHHTGVPSRSWTAPARPESVGVLRQEAAGFLLGAGMAGAIVDDVRIAVSEALANAVVHAYRHASEPGDLRLAVAVDAGAGLAEVTVGDDGLGLGPRDDSPGLGLGMPIIEHLAHAVVYSTPAEGGSEVSMRFRLEC
jgi:anti-sigma regulatory factor (Ser/Thr protein kinase)